MLINGLPYIIIQQVTSRTGSHPTDNIDLTIAFPIGFNLQICNVKRTRTHVVDQYVFFTGHKPFFVRAGVVKGEPVGQVKTGYRVRLTDELDIIFFERPCRIVIE